MTTELYPAFLQDEEYSAETLRHVFGSLLARGSAIGSIVGGLVASTDMQVTAGSGMQVLVATGEAWIPGTSVSTQGGYLGRVTSSTALAISAASESNPRIETIIAQVQDKAVAGGTDSFTVSVVVGTATSGATLANKLGAGSVPASSLVLAYVLVPAKAVSIVSGDIGNVAKRVKLPAESITGTEIDKETITKANLSVSLAGEITKALSPTSGFASLGATGVLKNEPQAFPSPQGITVVSGQVLLLTFQVALEPSENEALAKLAFNGTEITFGAYSASISGSVYQQSTTRRFTGLAGTYNVTGEAWATSAQGGASASVAYQLLNA